MIYLRVLFFLLAASLVGGLQQTVPPALAQPVAASVGVNGPSPDQPAVSADCTKPHSALPPATTRVYIALRNGTDGTGKSAADARDGSTVERFDSILRCYAEGCHDKSVAKTE